MSRRPAMSARAGWTRLSPPGDKCRAHWRHESGWEVRHCGHPTANWPYYARDPQDPAERCVVTHNGKGFRTLLDACEQIEAVLAGCLVATNSRCVPSVRRITTREDDRELAVEEARA